MIHVVTSLLPAAAPPAIAGLSYAPVTWRLRRNKSLEPTAVFSQARLLRFNILAPAAQLGDYKIALKDTV